MSSLLVYTIIDGMACWVYGDRSYWEKFGSASFMIVYMTILLAGDAKRTWKTCRVSFLGPN